MHPNIKQTSIQTLINNIKFAHRQIMKLHIFNPEHDLAMAANDPNFTPPHAARQLAHDLGFQPALWCDDGDYVLVDDMEHAESMFTNLIKTLDNNGIQTRAKVNFIDWNHLYELSSCEEICPWGWDKSIKHRLIKAGADVSLLPSDEEIEATRQLSHRRTSAKALRLFGDYPVGECHDMQEVISTIRQYGSAVVKMPWSSSGRGMRYIESHEMNPHQEGWIRNVIKRQGSVMVEPWYDKILDFAMEFHIENNIAVYDGLSMFYTENGQYHGNMLAAESIKEEILTYYISKEYIYCIKQKLYDILPTVLNGYKGELGVDMMIYRNKSTDCFDIIPCVEINLRRTIGHTALAISPKDKNIQKKMHIEFDGKEYKIKIS